VPIKIFAGEILFWELDRRIRRANVKALIVNPNLKIIKNNNK
jgi:hypothetical protein